jgi:hypothetical protein
MHEPEDAEERERLERVVRLGFAGDTGKFETFVDALREALPKGTGVVLRGSAVTGTRWADGQRFDADGPGTSDLDLTLVGGDALKLWDSGEFYIPALHTKPLCDKDPDLAPALDPLRRALQRIAGRPVNMQATADFVLFIRDVIYDQPYVTIVDKDETLFEPNGDARAAH